MSAWTCMHTYCTCLSRWQHLLLVLPQELEKQASRKLHINAKETMRIAEKLYTQGWVQCTGSMHASKGYRGSKECFTKSNHLEANGSQDLKRVLEITYYIFKGPQEWSTIICPKVYCLITLLILVNCNTFLAYQTNLQYTLQCFRQLEICGHLILIDGYTIARYKNVH